MIRFFRGVMLTSALSSCGAVLEKWEDTNSFTVAASPLCEETPGYEVDVGGVCKPVSPNNQTSPQLTGTNPHKTYLGRVVNESEYFCGKFLNGLVLAENTTNVGLDIMTTVFTAL